MKPSNALAPLDRSLVNPKFSHIYVEKGAETFADTQLVLGKFPKAKFIRIDDYRALFNRHGQRFQVQKTSMKLILAVKKDQFIYPGSPYAPNFGASNFYYNAVMLNCVYNCDYCYLQGMYSSGNIVLFVNQDAFLDAATQVLNEKGSIYLCISYDTDLLAFENIIPNCRRWITWAEHHPQALIEIRTKSANFRAIADLPPPDHTILAWTLSPSAVVRGNEKKTPPLSARLAAINEALGNGWKVRLCFDPLLRIKDWKTIYQRMFDEIFATIPGDQIFDFSLGVFRMNSEYLDRIRKERKDTPLLYYPFSKENRIYTYHEDERREMIGFVKTRIEAHVPNANIFDLEG